MSSVVSAGFPFVVKVEALPLLCLGKLSAGYVAMCRACRSVLVKHEIQFTLADLSVYMGSLHFR